MRRLVMFAGLLLFAAAVVLANGEEEAAQSGAAASSRMETLEGSDSASAAGVTVQWKVDGDLLTVQMSAATGGWVAVGFDPSRMMKDANIIIGYVKDGEAFLRDDFGTGNFQHGADTANGGDDNLSGVEGMESDGVTTLRFTIPLDSGDAADRALVPGNTYTVIVAHGTDRADDFSSHHGARGSFEIQL